MIFEYTCRFLNLNTASRQRGSILGKVIRRIWFIGILIIYEYCGASRAFGSSQTLKTIYGHVPAAILHLSPIGTLPPTKRLNLAIGLPLRDPKGLDDYLAQLYDPTSPHYRQYLTPEQFTEKFGPTTADYGAVIAFAEQNHLRITTTYNNRILLDVNGTVADIQNAFHITLRTYHHPTEARDFYAPDVEPTVALSLPIADISGLNNFVLPHPKSLRPSSLPRNTVTATGSGPDGTYWGNDFRAAYLPGVALTGTGQKIGLLEFDGFYSNDITSYESQAGLSTVPLQTVLLDGYNGVPTTGSDSGNPEVSLDIEMALCMAPGLSQIMVFEAGPSGLQNDVLNAMAASNQVSQLSSSWGWGGGPSTTTDTIFKQMEAQGQSFFEASGDSDAYTTGSNSVNGVDNPLLDNTPSSCPYITVVGGTTLTTTGPGGSWSSETVWNWGLDNGSYVGSSGGISSYYSIPAWQTGISMATNDGSTIYRNLPDVALTADNIYVVYGNGSSNTFGGTSCAAPLWAGLTALINQQATTSGKTNVGFLNPAIYALGKSTAFSANFHDITTGNDFSSDSPNLFYATNGYDLCSGWGTPAGQSLINALSGVTNWLELQPATGFSAIGPVGGPFSPDSETITLSNSASTSLTWFLVNTSAWLSVSSTNGTLAAGASASAEVSFASVADSLTPNVYTASLRATNHGAAFLIPFTLSIGQSTVENGGFETGDFTGWTFVGDGTVSSRSGTLIYDAVESKTNYPLVVHSGNYGAFLGDTKVATLSQTLTMVSGANYLVSFWLDNPTNGSLQIFTVNWNGTPLYGVTNPPAFSWTNFQYIVTATGSDTLQFGAENDPAYFGLDDVSVTPFPRPVFRTSAKTEDGFQLSWITSTGVVYQVQYKTNLLQTNWINLNNSFATTNYSTTILDTNANSASPDRFYRFMILP